MDIELTEQREKRHACGFYLTGICRKKSTCGKDYYNIVECTFLCNDWEEAKPIEEELKNLIKK